MAATAAYPIPLRRVGVAAVVLLLHAVMLVLLVRATYVAPPASYIPERVYWLSLRERATPVVPAIAPSPGPDTTTRPPTARLVLPAAPAPANGAPSADALRGLNLDLFGCAPEDLANLTSEQRARCAPSLRKHDGNSVDYADHTDRAHDARRWARGVVRKKSPLLLPCASPVGISPLGTAFCLANGILNGFDVQGLPGYADVQAPDHLPNNGDPVDPLKR